MKYSLNYLYIFVFTTLIHVFSSCSSDENLKSNIHGKWDIIKASRNGKRTFTFESGYFRFWHTDSIETNILGQKTVSYYQLNKKTIISDSNLPKIVVNKVVRDTLWIRTKFNIYVFDFMLKKNKNYENPIRY